MSYVPVQWCASELLIHRFIGYIMTFQAHRQASPASTCWQSLRRYYCRANVVEFNGISEQVGIDPKILNDQRALISKSLE